MTLCWGGSTRPLGVIEVIRTLSRRRGTAVAVVAAALVLAGALPAHAEEPDIHCIALLDDGSVVCAPTVEEADEAFTEETGLVRVSDGTALRGSVGTLAVYTLATLYPNNGYGGSSYTITRTFACNGSTVSGVPNLATSGMDNIVSSFQTYGGCQVRLYDGTSYTGSTFGWAGSSTSLGSFNDLASSVQVR